MLDLGVVGTAGVSAGEKGLIILLLYRRYGRGQIAGVEETRFARGLERSSRRRPSGSRSTRSTARRGIGKVEVDGMGKEATTDKGSVGTDGGGEFHQDVQRRDKERHDGDVEEC